MRKTQLRKKPKPAKSKQLDKYDREIYRIIQRVVERNEKATKGPRSR